MMMMKLVFADNDRGYALVADYSVSEVGTDRRFAPLLLLVQG